MEEGKWTRLTVGQLRDAIRDLPDEMPVVWHEEPAIKVVVENVATYGPPGHRGMPTMRADDYLTFKPDNPSTIWKKEPQSEPASRSRP